MRDVWRFTSGDDGALCVMMAGALLMPMWRAVNSVTAEPHVHVEVPTLVEAVVPSTMIMWPALGVRHVWLTAPIMALECTIVVTTKMQE